VNPFFFPRLGGIERRIYHVARHLARRGHEVTVLTGGAPGDAPHLESMSGFEVLRVPTRELPFRWDPPVQWSRGVQEALEGTGADVVDFHYRWAPEWTRAVERAGIPWVFTWHNQYGEGSGALRPLSLWNDAGYRRRVQSGAARIVCISQFIFDELAARRFDPARLVVVGNGSERPEEGGPEWQADDGRPLPAPPFFVAVGRLTPEKGNDRVLEAFADAVHRGADARLVLCGRGPERDRLEAQAARLAVAERVTFGGWVPEATKWRLLERAAGFVHMARFESYGIAIAEALVAGTPVVAGDVGGVAEVVGNGGLLVPDGDIPAAGAALHRLATDAAHQGDVRRRSALRGAGLGWAPVAERLEQVYAEAASMRA